MVDAEFFEKLRNDPVGAAADLHIALTERDVQYLRTEVEWDRIAENAEPIRESLHLEIVTNSW